MEKVRNYLLRHNLVNVYMGILSFLREPRSIDMVEILEKSPASIKNDIETELVQANSIYSKDKAVYTRVYSLGQVVIWQEVFSSYDSLKNCLLRIKSINLSPDTRNFEETTNGLKRILKIYAEMQGILSSLESTLGVDRFLDRVGEGTFVILLEILKEAKSILENKCARHKVEFQKNWNTTQIYKLLGHKLITPNYENQVCDLSTQGSEQVLLFVIDGFGFCQYLWDKELNSRKESFTFQENIFRWLSDSACSKEYLLGSTFVTDTAAGLSQIYLGQRSNETGILSSKLRKKYSGLNFFSTKTMSCAEFDEYFKCRNSILDVVTSFGLETKVYYCSKYQTPVSGFSKALFSNTEIEQILPPERVFSVLLDDIQNGSTQGLQVVYLTGIDNSGHTMGAYSAFEKYEHQKIASLLKNFLIELASDQPDLFNGKRSILITADHGMYESSNIIVSRYELLDALNDAGIRGVKLVEDNRAMLIYNEGRASNLEIKTVLKDYFRSLNISVDIQDEDDTLFAACISGDSTNGLQPDIIVRFIGEGLFYSSRAQSKHLLHYGGHGGYSIDEVFVPLIEIPLSQELLQRVKDRFLSKL